MVYRLRAGQLSAQIAGRGGQRCSEGWKEGWGSGGHSPLGSMRRCNLRASIKGFGHAYRKGRCIEPHSFIPTQNAHLGHGTSPWWGSRILMFETSGNQSDFELIHAHQGVALMIELRPSDFFMPSLRPAGRTDGASFHCSCVRLKALLALLAWNTWTVPRPPLLHEIAGHMMPTTPWGTTRSRYPAVERLATKPTAAG